MGPPRVCARCGRTRAHESRGLCAPCYVTVRRQGRLEDFAPAPGRRRSADVLEDWVELRRDGYTRRQAAERLGMTFKAFEQAITRARRVAS